MDGSTDAPLLWFLSLGAAWVLFAVCVGWLARARPRGDDIIASFVFRVIQVYGALVHRVSASGLEHIDGRTADRPTLDGRPLIVVANHTAGVDPMVVQAKLPFEVRWMMAEDMHVPALEWFWEFGRVIFVDRGAGERESRDTSGLRQAMRHLRGGGVLGMFPEGHIERPERMILPFKDGVGLLITKTGADVLPVIVEGTPQVDPAFASLTRTSTTSLRFLPVRRYERGERSAPEIASELRELFLRETGWPTNDHPPELRDGQWWYLDENGEAQPRPN